MRGDPLETKFGHDDLEERGYLLDLQARLVPEGPVHMLLGHHLPKIRVFRRSAGSGSRGASSGEEACVHGATPVFLNLGIDILLGDDTVGAMDGRAGASIDRSTPNDFGRGFGSGGARKVLVALRKPQRRQHVSIPGVDAVEVTRRGDLPRRLSNDGVLGVFWKEMGEDRALGARGGERILGGRGGAGTSGRSSSEGTDRRFVVRLVGWPTGTRIPTLTRGLLAHRR